MKHVRALALFVVFLVLTGCNGVYPGATNTYIGDWEWELTAHGIDGGGSAGSGTVSIWSEPGSSSGAEGTWSNCEGQCSADASGEADMFIVNQFVSVVLEGRASGAEPVYEGWLRATYLNPVSENTYEGIAEFGICTVEVECYSSTKIRLAKISNVPTYSAP